MTKEHKRSCPMDNGWWSIGEGKFVIRGWVWSISSKRFRM